MRLTMNLYERCWYKCTQLTSSRGQNQQQQQQQPESATSTLTHIAIISALISHANKMITFLCTRIKILPANVFFLSLVFLENPFFSLSLSDWRSHCHTVAFVVSGRQSLFRLRVAIWILTWFFMCRGSVWVFICAWKWSKNRHMSCPCWRSNTQHHQQ